MKFEATKTQIEGVRLFHGEQFQDDRGVNMEIFNSFIMKDEIPTSFPIQNVSYSYKGVLRGMHGQSVKPQGKLIRCLAGQIWDCWVDMRKDSKTFKKWECVTLSSMKSEAVYLPPGLLHGFFVPTTFAIVHYCATENYSPENQVGIRYDDASIKIEWPFEREFTPTISAKDLNLPRLDEYLNAMG